MIGGFKLVENFTAESQTCAEASQRFFLEMSFSFENGLSSEKRSREICCANFFRCLLVHLCMAIVLITGGTGLVGTALTEALVERGYHVIILSREARTSKDKRMSFAVWDVEKGHIDREVIRKADHIVHLAGASVAEKRWTTQRKKDIYNSRVNGSKLLVKSLADVDNNVRTVIAASAIGYYGDDKRFKDQRPFTEEDPADDGFLGETCVDWENAIDPISLFGKRLVKLRLGIVLSKEGGALKEFLRSTKFGVAAILGSGKQIISWIHIDDLVRMILFTLENENVQGVYNAVAPKPISNKKLMLALTRKVKGKFFVAMHIPSVVLKVILGEMSIEILKSATVSSRKIEDAGFIFQYPTLQSGLSHLLSYAKK